MRNDQTSLHGNFSCCCRGRLFETVTLCKGFGITSDPGPGDDQRCQRCILQIPKAAMLPFFLRGFGVWHRRIETVCTDAWSSGIKGIHLQDVLNASTKAA